jgi:RNA polymerase sigma-70 factor, ECF subfamily
MERDNLKNTLDGEEVIVERAKKDDQYFEILYDHYLPKIYGYIFKRVGNREVAEDLTSVTFMKVFCSLGKYKEKGHGISPWIYRIATNNLIDYYRKAGKKREVELERAENIVDSGLSQSEVIERKEESIEINRVIDKLPDKYKRVIHLKFFGDLSNSEIAVSLGIKPNNANVLVHRSINKFRQIYNK